MTTRIPSPRLAHSALAAFRTSTTNWAPSASLPLVARRTFKIPNPFKEKDPDPNADLSNPELEKYFAEKEAQETSAEPPSRPQYKPGGMAPSSLFQPEIETPGWRADLTAEEQKALATKHQKLKYARHARREKKLKAFVLDPAPQERREMERQLVIESVSKHGRMSKERKIMRTERQSLYKSQDFPTSVKKLTKIMDQIAGQSVTDALVQLRFSKKRVARDVYKALTIARDEAIAGRGMGLGMRASQLADGTDRQENFEGAKLIELKDGKRKLVTDPTEIYIDQAWVGRGEKWNSIEQRARGRSNLLIHRTTSFSVLLKEEKTRMRISEEIKKKRDNRKLWVALPDRPVTAQRQYCLW